MERSRYIVGAVRRSAEKLGEGWSLGVALNQQRNA
jgi:hypothetical protein